MIRPSNRNVEQTVCRLVDAGISELDALGFGSLPFSIFGNASNKSLAAQDLLAIDVSRRQSHFMIDPRFVFSRRGKLEHFGIGFAFQHAMPDLRRLKNTVARLEPKRLALALRKRR